MTDTKLQNIVSDINKLRNAEIASAGLAVSASNLIFNVAYSQCFACCQKI
jgi:hypothetical protein